MSPLKKVGIWMDHSVAKVMDYTSQAITTTTVNSKFTHLEKEHTLSKSENVMHNKEQHQQGDYYKHLSEIIRNYNEVLLFGPTDAKLELHNLIKEDHNFSDINIEVKTTDKLSENQQQAFVKNYFLNKL